MKFLLPVILLLGSFSGLAQREVENTTAFTIEGKVKKTLTIDMAAIRKYPQVVIGDMAIKNQKGEPKETAHSMKGVLLKTFIDSAEIDVAKHKEMNGIYILLLASDGYKSVYSWNEMFNNEVGDHVYIVTEKDGKPLEQMDGAILVVSASDINAGRRHLKGLKKVEVKMAEE